MSAVVSRAKCLVADCGNDSKSKGYCSKHYHRLVRYNDLNFVKQVKHGLSGKAGHYSWKSMRTRCNNPNAAKYKDYGGRGITICERWNSFPNFLEDMGVKPPGKSLDRIDNNGNYEPSNCRWATATEQANNRRVRRITSRDKFGRITEVGHAV